MITTAQARAASGRDGANLSDLCIVNVGVFYRNITLGDHIKLMVK